MKKPGRNDPCYCGSGKKYKQCHMRADLEEERQQRARADAARFLREALPQFARDKRFAADFAAALRLYWNDQYDVSNAHEMSEFEAARFLDWFVFDYTLENGRRLIDIYHEEQGEQLTAEQQAVLTEWLEAPPAGAYTLVDYEGQTLQLRDFLTGETYSVFEPGGRGAVEIGEVILGRLVPVAGQLVFNTSPAYLPADEIADLKEKLEAAQAADAADHPQATPVEFMRRHNHLLIHHALEQAERKGRPSVARLDPQRTDPPVRHWETQEHEHDKERVHRQRNYGATQPHTGYTRRKAI